MRLDSSLLQNERQVTKSSRENSGVTSQSATVSSTKSSKDGNISVFGGGIVYEKSAALHARRTPNDETKESELLSHGARGPGKLLSKFIDDRSRPKEANARKRDIDSIKSTSTPHLPISNTKTKTAVKSTDTTKDTVNTSSSGTIVRHNLEKDNTKSNNESKKRNTIAMKNTDITTSKEGPKQKVAKISLTEPKPLETNWLSDMQGIAQVAQPAQSMFQKADFAGIERFCRNAGSTKEGIASFIKKASSSDSFAVSLMWSSQFAPVSLSSNHSTCSVKYCTPSVACYRWYCSCDRHIRVQQAFEPLLGALILFPDEQQHLYFLPLSKCNHPTSSDATQTDNSTSESKNSIPLNCKTTLRERWEAFLKVVLHKQSQKIIYNFQLTLLPLFAACYGLRDDIQIDSHFVGELTVIENVFDPRIAAYICETDTQESGFEFLALCSRFEISLSPISGSGGNLGLVAVAVGQCHAELKALLQLKSHLQVEIEKREGSMKVLKMLEMPLVALLSLMELRGVEMSQQILKGINEKIDLKLASIIEEAHQLVGPFNLASPEQVANILYTKLKLPTKHTSAKGRHSSTSEEDLLKIRTLHPVVNMILSFRSLSKISTTYISGLRPFILRREEKLVPHGIESTQLDISKNANQNFFDSGADRKKPKNSFEVCSRVHANWNQTTVRTGRLSCCRPNLQNIPNEQTVGGLDIVVRTAFKASQG
jgi:DNA polymerase family A